MTRERFEAERDYRMALRPIGALHRQELVSDGEFEAARAALIGRYKPPIGTLCP